MEWKDATCALLALVGCAADDLQTSSASESLNIDLTVARPSEDRLLQIAGQWPYFSGYFCKSGDLVVGTVGLAIHSPSLLVQQLSLEEISSSCLQRTQPFRSPQVRAVDQKYTFLELRHWRDLLWRPVLNISGVNGIGIDYQENRLSISVDVGTQSSVMAFLSGQLPHDAFEIVERGRKVPRTACAVGNNGPTLRECFRQIPGGVEIGVAPNNSNTIGHFCTLTVPATRDGLTGWVTASHCLPAKGNEFDWTFQPGTDPVSNFVGVEFADPVWTDCSFYHQFPPPLGEVYAPCEYRLSDAAWIASYSRDMPQPGTIAQTQNWNGVVTSCDPPSGTAACRINTNTPRFFVGAVTSSIQGMEVEKIGRASGWTTGTVTRVCVDEPGFDPDHIHAHYVCQDEATVSSFEGDSGSPVFHWRYFEGTQIVDLLGVASASDVMTNSPSAYSPWANALIELGPMDPISHPLIPEIPCVTTPCDCNGPLCP